jgi:hypothetical protein
MLYTNSVLNQSRVSTNTNSIFVNKKNTRNFTTNYNKNKKNLTMQSNSNNDEEKQKLLPEKVFFEGPPSKVELLIPFFSILTVIGIIPFVTTLLRQVWVNYKITNRRISVDSGFQGNTRAEIVYRDIKKIKYIKRLGGQAADVVLVLKDNAQLELRSLPNWEENLDFIKSNCSSDVECQ